MADTNLHQRVPYESEERLQDGTLKNDLSEILGLHNNQFNNSDPLPLPQMFGAGRVKKFRNENIKQQGRPAMEVTNDGRPARRPDIERGVHRNTDTESHSRHLQGYPALAQFIGSEKDFFIFRKFASLSARNLLYLQDELVELEGKLRDVDLGESLGGSAQEFFNLHTRRDDSNTLRKSLMKEIRAKLHEYHSAIRSEAFLLTLESAPDIHADSIANWLDGVKPIVEEESHFLDDRKDLVSLTGGYKSKELLERYIERNWYQFFNKKKRNERTTSNVEYYSAGRIKHAARILLAMLAAVFAVLPIPIMIFFSSKAVRILIVSIFAVIFAAMFTILTNGRTSEMFAGMAAYAAFLAVFVTNSSSDS